MSPVESNIEIMNDNHNKTIISHLKFKQQNKTNEKSPFPVKWSFVMGSCQQHSNLSHLNPLKL